MFLLYVEHVVSIQISQSQGHRERDVSDVVPQNVGPHQFEITVVEMGALPFLKNLRVTLVRKN